MEFVVIYFPLLCRNVSLRADIPPSAADAADVCREWGCVHYHAPPFPPGGVLPALPGVRGACVQQGESTGGCRATAEAGAACLHQGA